VNKAIRKVYSLLRKAIFFMQDFVNFYILGRYPIKYFDAVLNVGDQINPYLVERMSNKKPFNVRSGFTMHVIGLGSMFHVANNKSIIWGTGIISDSLDFKKRTTFSKLNAVRGKLTKKLLIENGISVSDNVVLGDPGVLMPLFYSPSVKKIKRVGVIPHYVDSDILALRGEGSVHIIDVSQGPEAFVEEILSCEFIISSSLHGLILSDAYGVPNKWASFSDKITGGPFKYHDYYSTTDRPKEECVVVNSPEILANLMNNIENISSVKKYIFNRQELIDVFPEL
jgi:pyruvyltransferase